MVGRRGVKTGERDVRGEEGRRKEKREEGNRKGERCSHMAFPKYRPQGRGSRKRTIKEGLTRPFLVTTLGMVALCDPSTLGG